MKEYYKVSLITYFPSKTIPEISEVLSYGELIIFNTDYFDMTNSI